MADNPRDAYDTIAEYLCDNSRSIIHRITGRPESDFQVDANKLKVLKRGVFSSVASVGLTYTDLNKGQSELNQRLLIKFFEDVRDPRKRLRHFKDFAEAAIETCSFLSEGDKNGDSPAYYFADKRNGVVFLALGSLGDKTLHEVTSGFGPVEISSAIQNIFPYVSRFQIENTVKLGEWIRKGKINKKNYNALFGKRNSLERVVDYLRALKGKEKVNQVSKTLRESVLRSSAPIPRIYGVRRGTLRVTHGDLIFKNIIQREDDPNMYGFIDSELTLGKSMIDLGALLSTPNLGLNPSDWEYLSKVFTLANERALEETDFDLHAVREKMSPTLEELGVEFSIDEPPGNNLFGTFGSLFFRSSRIAAKVADLRIQDREKYERMLGEDSGIEVTGEDMRRNMSLSLGEIVRSPDKFDISRDEYVANLKDLHEVLGNEGIIGSLEDYPTNNNGNKKAKN